jgi:hypothetical protein
MVYRILKQQGFIYRARVYEMSRLQCRGVGGPDDVEEKFDETIENEAKYTQNETNYDYDDSPNRLFEDFVMPVSTRITALNLYGGNTITYS